ncbi:hypothetical protein GCM10009789_40270 [Kribbella sancticallisti]|uniref:Uncharacterized protein n=1 Tax=Kribbella sancticallisti TaxID=460087 RepID=A0ABN2DPB1_9ACTN
MRLGGSGTKNFDPPRTLAAPKTGVVEVPADARPAAGARDHAGRRLADRQLFYMSDWEDKRRAAQCVGRTADEFCGWPLAYRQESPGSSRWLWAAGADRHRADVVHEAA